MGQDDTHPPQFSAHSLRLLDIEEKLSSQMPVPVGSMPQGAHGRGPSTLDKRTMRLLLPYHHAHKKSANGA